MTIQAKNAENGVNVAALLGAREALSRAPEAARFKWRATSTWLKGTHSRATMTARLASCPRSCSNSEEARRLLDRLLGEEFVRRIARSDTRRRN